MSRRIIVASATTGKAKTFESTATTFGAFKREMGSLYNDGLEAIVKETKTTLGRDDSALPEGPFTIFLVAKKNKAGQTLIGALSESLSEAIAVAEAETEDENGYPDVDAIEAAVLLAVETFFGGFGASDTNASAAEKEAIEALKTL